ncbi:PmoA family protein [Streptomyces aidingensis]|uniref:Methane oxygenase PmoA n=1 Tax=Streptomyces aidingensis TaxID=910347 RepID=A0A1I1SEY7_9ACTN|nr:PmoA family protein [Streptomyces aidingensis]SFD45055.1 Methane oxygenase PmoA [Streptomyces aidingensis]
MNVPLKDTGTELIVEIRGVEVLRYVYRPDTAGFEAPKPYFHPLRTTAGDVVTCFRPHDHRWHKGIQMTASWVSGENFWGGGTYVSPEQGYVDLPNNGSMRHEEWVEPGVERLTWWTQGGEHWIDETRTLTVRPGEGWWELGFATSLHNVRGEELVFGSPTTNGREMAGYAGFFWRGPRSFTGGTVLASDGQGGPEMMGRTASWLAFTGPHDEVDRSSTLLFESAPGTVWFVRAEPFAAVNPSLAFFEETRLGPGETLDLAYRVVIAEGAWGRDRLEAHLADHPWERQT